MQSTARSVVLLSGGLDSTTLLYLLAKREKKEVLALSIYYGQRHSRELDFARRNALGLDVYRVLVDLSSLHAVFASSGSSQVGRYVPVPEGHYAADNMAVTVVPNRNSILLSVAGAFAFSQAASEIAYAAHLGDHDQYPDCRAVFIEAFDHALRLATEEKVHLYTPFKYSSKSDIVRLGAELGVPFGSTWSCYSDGEVHCGRCGTCVERAEAFSLAGVPDPTQYTDSEFWKTVCASH